MNPEPAHSVVDRDDDANYLLAKVGRKKRVCYENFHRKSPCSTPTEEQPVPEEKDTVAENRSGFKSRYEGVNDPNLDSNKV